MRSRSTSSRRPYPNPEHCAARHRCGRPHWRARRKKMASSSSACCNRIAPPQRQFGSPPRTYELADPQSRGGAVSPRRSSSPFSPPLACACPPSSSRRCQHQHQHGVRDDVPGRRSLSAAPERTERRRLDPQPAAPARRRQRLPHRRSARPVRSDARLQDGRRRVGRSVQVGRRREELEEHAAARVPAGRVARGPRVADQGT